MRRLLVLLLVLVPAAPATAGSGVGVTDGRMHISDSAHAANAIHVAPVADGRLQVVDSSGANAYPGCEQIDAMTVRCEAPREIVAMLSDGPDLFMADASITVPIQVDGGQGDNRIRGGSGPDRLGSDYGNDQIDGGAGDDTVRGEGGDDLLLGGDGVDYVHGGPGFDDLDGGPGRDTIDGDNERDRLRYPGRSAGVHVKLVGSPWDTGSEDVIYDVEAVEGTPYDDVIHGGRPDEEIDGGPGDDRISGGLGADVLRGGPGADRLFGDASDPTAPGEMPTASGGADQLSGGPGDDTLRGDGDRDRLSGDDGDDVIDAREGTSTHEVLDEEPACGAGADRAILDWNDDPSDCETVDVRPRPGFSRPRPDPVAEATPGPGPQPVLGRPLVTGGVIGIPVHCPGTRPCSARLRVRGVRMVRAGGRRRARAGDVHMTRRAVVPAGTTSVTEMRLPARLRRARRARVIVELSLGGRRWARPLVLQRAH